ncbi:MAG: ABC transporter permease subunit [Marinosulfonomonas sp.]|nr:ABC transporter permease subunit [Marinosulfonomonas sp.]
MTTLTDPPKESFRLSMLLYDTRYRSTTIQVIALMGFMLGAAWLVNNVIVNLAAAGKTFNFGFLGEASGYDINQKLLEYNSQSTHLRAAVIGLMNTLLVAVMGCILATFLGVIIGVLRLSSNWVISRLMAVYVEMFRNVPVLLWIVLIMAATSHQFPAPKDFRGDEPAATMKVFDSIAVTNRGVYFPEPLFSESLGNLPVFPDASTKACEAFNNPGDDPKAIKLAKSCGTFQISLDLMAILAVLFAGLMTSKLIANRAAQIQAATGNRPTVWYLRLGVVAIPTLFVLWILGFYLGYPELKGFNFKGGIHMRSSLLALWLALSLYTAAFIAEIVRAGIMAISKGQSEAAAALGIRPSRTMKLVILPQAMRVIFPPLISQYLNLTKNSSLAIAVGYMDVTGTLGGITLNQTGRELETILLLMLCYLIISLSVSTVMNAYNERTKLKER